MDTKAKSVDEYLTSVPEDKRGTLLELRRLIKEAAPEAVEGMAYGMPGFKYRGRPLVYFAAAKNHCALYGPAVVAFADELPAIYARSQLLVLPSLMEGMPNVVLEAMAAGLPVIATRVGGCPELVADGENGLLVEPGSPPALAAALSAVLAHKDSLQEWGAASRRRVAAFSWDAVVDGYLALAETAAGRRRRPTPASLPGD